MFVRPKYLQVANILLMHDRELVPACVLYHWKTLIVRPDFSISRQVLHFCMLNFVFRDKANWVLSRETKFHIQNT
jgi:hypothetical protein